MAYLLKSAILSCSFCLLIALSVTAQEHSVARKWNEAHIQAIKKDFARPTVHARNLFHASIAMYDAWAVYDDSASTYFLNHSFRHFHCPFEGIRQPANRKAAQEEAMSYAMYRLLQHRFKDSPGASQTLPALDKLFTNLGFDASFISTDYAGGAPAALGNYIAEKLIEYGMGDGANEAYGYQNTYYEPVNPYIFPFAPGNSRIVDVNRWQPLQLENFIDQGGNTLDEVPPFLSPEWGKVVPFALKEEDLKVYTRDGNKYWVYHDPGMPPQMNMVDGSGTSADYAWNFLLVSIWGSHLDPDDGVMIDISPASTGNITDFPTTAAEMQEFYQLTAGGDAGTGYSINPKTGQAYQPQLVPRGDYSRVLAEFWADGPSSETPPGHWFTILNYVNDHPQFQKKMGGQGAVLDDLEWDVKAYLTLGGAVHDAAISAWGIKGYYDYVRPISAIRAMAEKGQSSNPQLPNYHPAGIPLIEGFIEVVQAGDSLAKYEYDIGKIKLYTWRGHPHVDNPFAEKAGVGWILAENWWPYQRPTFVTPPFAGYVSGHSTFSRSAAEVLTLLTGDEYFPGGMSEFQVRANRFLVFEEGPSVDLTLQWAKYKDASDQCSLSRIWGGIHPPVDDIPGRIIGQKIGVAAFNYATRYFKGEVAPEAAPKVELQLSLYPNPLRTTSKLQIKHDPFVVDGKMKVMNTMGQVLYERNILNNADEVLEIQLDQRFRAGMYLVKIESKNQIMSGRFVVNP